MSKEIDLVIPYVDGTEPIWRSAFDKYHDENQLEKGYSPVRFRVWDNFQYLLRGVAENMPWIRNIYLIVSNIEQVPNWINRDKVIVILHKNIIPKQYLPTFNSCTIEMFLKNIPGLSEYFIYANDDMFPIKSFSPEDFFDKNDNPIFYIYQKDRSLNTQFKRVEWACQELVVKDTSFKIPEGKSYKIAHNIVPMRKSILNKVFSLHKDQILNSVSALRKATNYNQYIYTYYSFFSKQCTVLNKPVAKYFDLLPQNINQIVASISSKSDKLVCVNDVTSDIPFDALKSKINTAFESIFPNKCKYEKGVEEKKLKPKITVKKINNVVNINPLSKEPVDFIFSYVDSTDPVWQASFKETFPDKEIDPLRYQPDGTLKYLFRGIEKYASWINNVYIIVSNKEQVPDWLNTSRVKVILHEDFIPKEYLPTFNSMTISKFLGNIEGLSEKFIWGNDDTFVINTLNKSDMFRDNKPLIKLKEISPTSINENGVPIISTLFATNCFNAYEMISGNRDKLLVPNHNIQPKIKSHFNKMLEEYSEQILSSLSQSREEKNQCYTDSYYTILNGLNSEGAIKENYLAIDSDKKYEQFKSKLLTEKTICLNYINNEYKERVINDFDNKFPTPSKYEIANLKLSVIVPAYNCANYIKFTIDSILAQTYSNFEVLVINDGSTDNTVEVVNSINDPRVKLISQSNKGAGAARNNGIDNATGDYITFVDSDDYLDPNAFMEIMSAIFKSDSKIIQYKFQQFEEDITHPFLGHKFLQDQGEGEMKLTEAKKYNFIWNKAYELNLIRENNIRFMDWYNFYLEDFYFYILLSNFYNHVYLIDKPLYYWRQHSDSFGKSTEKNELFRVKQVEFTHWAFIDYCTHFNLYNGELKSRIDRLSVNRDWLIKINHLDKASLLEEYKCINLPW